MALNAALTNGTREYQPQPRRERTPATHRRVRYEALLARVRSRQLDLAMMGQVEHSAVYARRAMALTQRMVIVDAIAGMGDMTEVSDSLEHADEPMLACCGV